MRGPENKGPGRRPERLGPTQYQMWVDTVCVGERVLAVVPIEIQLVAAKEGIEGPAVHLGQTDV